MSWASAAARLLGRRGVGTTPLAGAPGIGLAPAFEGLSRQAHLASGAVEFPLRDVDSVRRDVDTLQDLHRAAALRPGRTLPGGAPAYPAARLLSRCAGWVVDIDGA